MSASWTERADRELAAIVDYISMDDAEAAFRWADKIITRAEAASKMKYSGRVVPELNLEEVREVFVGSYRIMYRVLPAGIRVLCVLEGHKLLAGDLDP